ncbi:hypothetical protein D3C87_1761290 [compost metagenome]
MGRVPKIDLMRQRVDVVAHALGKGIDAPLVAMRGVIGRYGGIVAALDGGHRLIGAIAMRLVN